MRKAQPVCWERIESFLSMPTSESVGRASFSGSTPEPLIIRPASPTFIPTVAFCSRNISPRPFPTPAQRAAAIKRLRAERRCGELLRELERAPHRLAGRDESGNVQVSTTVTPEKSPYAQALSDAGLSRQRAHRMEASLRRRIDRLEAKHQAKPGNRRVFIAFPGSQTPEQAAKLAADVAQAERNGFDVMTVNIVARLPAQYA